MVVAGNSVSRVKPLAAEEMMSVRFFVGSVDEGERSPAAEEGHMIVFGTTLV